MFSLRYVHRISLACAMLLSSVALGQAAEIVKAYCQEAAIERKKAEVVERIPQQRWYLENAFVRLAATDDPGGAVVEFTDKRTGVNHVAGEVWSRRINGRAEKHVGWGWKEPIYDNATDPAELHMDYQPFQVEFQEGESGAKAIHAQGRTKEQQVDRWITLRPDSAEVQVKLRVTNIADHPRRLWLRWHPYSYASSDRFGDAGCVLVPGEGADVRKIRIGWGWDHWFRVCDGYWMAADFRTGEGLFITFEKEKLPILTTWTEYGPRNETKGALTLELCPAPEMRQPGAFDELNLTYFSFSKDTAPESIPLGLISGEAEQERARKFLANAKPLPHLELMNRYTFAKSAQFNWMHRRRDVLGLADWGFADCAIVNYPLQGLSTRVRMVGGVFDEAIKIPRFPAANCTLSFAITMKDQKGVEIYRAIERYQVMAGVPGQNFFDREIPIPGQGIPDGTYTLRVEAIDPITNKPFHFHQVEGVVFGKRMETEDAVFAQQVAGDHKDRPFVTALASQAEVQAQDGKAVIPIGIEDGSATQRVGFPVRLGVPFPQGAFKDDAPVQLLAPDGKLVQAQFRVMNVWPDKSLKWLQADFQADCPGDGFAFYKLGIGSGLAAAAGGPDIAKETGESVELNTGAMLIRINKGNLTIPGEVFLDRNGNGRFEDVERVILPSQVGDAWWTDDQDNVYRLQLSGESSCGFSPGVVIESNGPLSAVIKMTGWYLDGNAKAVALGEVRVEAFKGQKFFKLWHQVTFTGSPWRDRIKSYGLKLRFSPVENGKVAVALDGKSVAVPGVASLYQKTADLVELKNGAKSAGVGHKASGAVSVTNGRDSLLVYHRELWQMYPKKLTADPAKGEIELHYWPAEAGIHSFEPNDEFWIPSSSSGEACGTGAGRTEEMVIDFSGIAVEKAEAVHGEPVIACTPPAWVQKTQVLQNLYPHDSSRYVDVERFTQGITDFFDRSREFFGWYGHWTYGTNHNVYSVPNYQWLVVGRYANIGNEEDIVDSPWLLYFRSGDRRYYKFGRIWTRHLMEVQSIRWHNTYPEWAGMSRRHHYTPWLGGGDWGHTMLCPYLEYYHADGYYPAWDMAQRAVKAMANTYQGEWRYISNPLIGNIRMYSETGDEQYKAVADRIWKELCAPDRNQWYHGSHAARMVRWYAPFNPECLKMWKDLSATGEINYADSVAALGNLTGDPQWAHLARLLADTARSVYSGQIWGTNPVYRGFLPITDTAQASMTAQREMVYAAGQIEKSQRLFPASFLNIRGVREVVVKKDKDEAFTIWMSAPQAGEIKLIGPDGKPAQVTIEAVFDNTAATKGARQRWFAVTVNADSKVGCYRMPVGRLGYFGCSLRQVAIVVGNTLNASAGADLYVRSNDLGAPQGRVLLKGSPCSSLEVFAPSGERVFSKTYVRPESDAVGIEYRCDLPANTVLRLGDKVGALFPQLISISLYLNADGVFDLPSSNK